MAWAHVQGTGTGNSASATLSSNVTVGNLVVVGYCRFVYSAGVGISDNLGNTWHQVGIRQGNANSASYLWYTVVSNGGSMTVTISSPSSGCVTIDEFSGVPSPLYVNGTTSTYGTSNAPAGGDLATSGSSLIYAVLGVDGSAGTYTAGSGYTLGFTYPYGAPDGVACEYKLNTTTNPESPAFSLGSSVPWAMSSVSFGPSQPAAGSWAHRQGQGVARSASATLPASTPAGSLVVVSAAGSAIGSTASCSDNQGNAYTKVIVAGGVSATTAYIFYALVTNAGQLAVTVANGNVDMISVDEFAGVPTGMSVVGSSGGTGSSTSPATGNITVGGNNLVLAAVATGTTASAYTPSGGYTVPYSSLPVSGSDGIAVEYLMGTSSTPANPGFTLGSSTVWGMAGASFGGPAVTPIPAAILPMAF